MNQPLDTDEWDGRVWRRVGTGMVVGIDLQPRVHDKYFFMSSEDWTASSAALLVDSSDAPTKCRICGEINIWTGTGSGTFGEFWNKETGEAVLAHDSCGLSAEMEIA